MIVCVKFMPQSISRDLISGLFITVLQNINQSQLINISHGSRKVEKVMLQIQVQFCWLHSFNTFFFCSHCPPSAWRGVLRKGYLGTGKTNDLKSNSGLILSLLRHSDISPAAFLSFIFYWIFSLFTFQMLTPFLVHPHPEISYDISPASSLSLIQI